ncbi:hypothetical protein B0H19DRAFT_965776 [Mycena capillaripes]|nr:hypothetical protein B0H19DRAFT_965776 [Mycena capillaripes]
MHLSRVFSVSLGTIAAAAVDILDTRQPIFLAEETPILNARLETAIWDILKEFRAPGGVVVALVRKTAQRTWQLESTGYGNATSHVDPTSTAPCSRSHLTQLRSSPSVLIFILGFEGHCCAWRIRVVSFLNYTAQITLDL